jgi:ABC-2 type transport system permease protein
VYKRQQEGQALGFFFYMLMISPLVAIVAIGENPNGPLAIGMSILPFTSLFAISLRNLFISIPAWQIALSILVLWLSVILSLWLATRAFRLGMLRYGQRLRLDEILGRTGQKDLMQGELQGSEG